jgi:hypothetical protein
MRDTGNESEGLPEPQFFPVVIPVEAVEDQFTNNK